MPAPTAVAPNAPADPASTPDTASARAGVAAVGASAGGPTGGSAVGGGGGGAVTVTGADAAVPTVIACGPAAVSSGIVTSCEKVPVPEVVTVASTTPPGPSTSCRSASGAKPAPVTVRSCPAWTTSDDSVRMPAVTVTVTVAGGELPPPSEAM